MVIITNRPDLSVGKKEFLRLQGVSAMNRRLIRARVDRDKIFVIDAGISRSWKPARLRRLIEDQIFVPARGAQALIEFRYRQFMFGSVRLDDYRHEWKITRFLDSRVSPDALIDSGEYQKRHAYRAYPLAAVRALLNTRDSRLNCVNIGARIAAIGCR